MAIILQTVNTQPHGRIAAASDWAASSARRCNQDGNVELEIGGDIVGQMTLVSRPMRAAALMIVTSGCLTQARIPKREFGCGVHLFCDDGHDSA